MKSKEIQLNTENKDDQLKKLFSIKNESLLIYNKCVLMNEEISTNGIYNEIYNKNLFSLQKELAVEEQKHLSRRNEEEKK